MVRSSLIMVLLLSLLIMGCSSDKKEEVTPDQETTKATQVELEPETPTDSTPRRQQLDVEYQPVSQKYTLTGEAVHVGGLSFVPAVEWNYLGGSGDTVAHYTWGPFAGEERPARLAVHFVKAADAASYDDYFAHWLSMIDFSHLEDPASAAARHDRQADGMTAHVQSLYGSYFPPSQQIVEGEKIPRPRRRLLGVVVETPEGLVLFELVGPDETARIMIEPFMYMIYRLSQAG